MSDRRAPAPFVPPDVDMTHFEAFLLHTRALLFSELFGMSTGDEFKAAVALWCSAWHQVPAGSLPNDEQMLASLARLSPRKWRAVAPMALRGFVLCSDGRLYHKVLSKVAMRAWSATKKRPPEAISTIETSSKTSLKTSFSAKSRLRSTRVAEARSRGKHSPQQWKDLLELSGGACVKCGTIDPAGGLVKGRIVPFYCGGSDSIDNIQPLCRGCNSTRGADQTDHRKNVLKNVLKTSSKTSSKTSEDVRELEEEEERKKEVREPPRLAAETLPPTRAGEADPVLVLGDAACLEAGFDPSRWTGNYQPVVGWLANGFSSELVLATIRTVAARPGYTPPRAGLGYFTPAIREHAAWRREGIPWPAPNAREVREAAESKRAAEFAAIFAKYDRPPDGASH